MATDVPIGPFGVTIDDVTTLVPEATVPETLSSGQKGVTQATVEGWITRLSADAALALDGYENLADAGRLSAVETSARRVVADGVASYLEAARAPERAGKADTSYAAVLWDRWLTGLAALVVKVVEWREADPATVRSSAASRFPEPVIPDSKVW